MGDAAAQEVRLLLLAAVLLMAATGLGFAGLSAFWPLQLVACACLKIAYDLALWRAFRYSDQVVSDVETK